jgi:hypothetical protein
MMSRIDSRHWKISIGRHFQNGHHNTAQIRYVGRLWCPQLIPVIEKFLPVNLLPNTLLMQNIENIFILFVAGLDNDVNMKKKCTTRIFTQN